MRRKNAGDRSQPVVVQIEQEHLRLGGTLGDI